MMRIAVADQSPVFTQFLFEIFQTSDEYLIKSFSADDLLELNDAPDITLLDATYLKSDCKSLTQNYQASLGNAKLIICSPQGPDYSAVTIQSLIAGADEYIVKPSDDEILNNKVAREQFTEKLLFKLKSHLTCTKAVSTDICELPYKLRIVEEHLDTYQPEVIAIGVSTGGPQVLMSIIPNLPADFHLPILIAQHVPTGYSGVLVDSIASASKIHVIEATDNIHPKPGVVYFAPSGKHMIVVRDKGNIMIKLTETELVNYCRPSVDVLFKSIADIYHDKALALILTGIGFDGLDGCAKIHENGGVILAQDEVSSAVWSMPGSVVGRGLASHVLNPDEISLALQSMRRHGLKGVSNA